MFYPKYKVWKFLLGAGIVWVILLTVTVMFSTKGENLAEAQHESVMKQTGYLKIQGGPVFIRRIEDKEKKVTCYMLWKTGIACVRERVED